MSPLLQKRRLRGRVRRRALRGQGFSLIELLLGATILAVGLLAILSMFSTGYSDVGGGGKTTSAVSAARQILEDMHTLPFGNLGDLNNFATNNPGSLPAPAVDPATNPGRAMAIDIGRKWRYALAGEGAGWNFTTAEKNRWKSLSGVSGVVFGGTGQITVVAQSATLRLVTVSISIPGRTPNLRLATIISSL